MKILVCAKQVATVPGPAVLLKDASDIDPHFTLRRIGEVDEQALEVALRLCDTHAGSTVVAVSVGPDASTEVLRTCLAMGAHRAVRLWRDNLPMYDPLSVARALSRQVLDEAADLVLCGVQSADAAQQVTGPAIAAFLRWPSVTVATKVEVSLEQRRILVHREAGAGRIEVVETALPAVITVQTGVSSPRKPSFKSLMNAKRAPVTVVDPGPENCERIRLLGMAVPPRVQRRLQVLDGAADEVAAKIANFLRQG